MKLIKKITSFALSAIMLSGMALTGANAQIIGGDLVFKEVKNAETVVTYSNGSQKTFSGILDAVKSEESAAIGAVSSYEIKCSGKSMLTVTLRDIVSSNSVAASSTQLNGYYAIDIDNMKDNKSAFITGLSPSNVQSVETALIDAVSKGESMDITSIDFIDTEKKGVKDVDESMCWAGAISNILTYTGWAQKAGFKDCDDMFEKFIDCYNDDGNIMEYALSWFINGAYDPDWEDEYFRPSAVPKKGTGGYLKDYAYDKLLSEDNFLNNPDGLNRMAKELRSGKGVTLGIQYYDKKLGMMGGHAISCWGYVTNNNYTSDKREYYDMLVITDSDSDLTGEADRRTAPNRLCAHKLEPISFNPYNSLDYDIINTETWLFSGYGSYILYDYSAVTPYSENLEKETLLKATKNKNTTVDFAATDIFTGESDNPESHESIPDDAEAFLNISLSNLSYKDFNSSVAVNLTVTDSSGKNVFNQTKSFEADLSSMSYSTLSPAFNAGKLKEGKYNATATINSDKKVREAYYYNNTVKTEFTVTKAVFDRSNIKLKLSNPKLGEQKVTYDFSVEGLTNDQLKMITKTELFTVEEYEFDPGNYLEEEADCEFESGSLFPTSVSVYNKEELKLKLKLYIKNSAPIYIQTDWIIPDFPEVAVFSPDDEEVSYEFKVDENAAGFKDGEKLSFALTNLSSETYKNKTVSGTFHLEVTDQNGDSIPLTKPQSFSLKYDEQKNFSISKFDYTLPRGSYILKVVLDGDFVKSPSYDYTSIFFTVGEPYEDDYYVGDVNMDNALTISDATLIQKYIAMMVDFSDLQLELADVDGNGTVNINDVTTLQKMIAE